MSMWSRHIRLQAPAIFVAIYLALSLGLLIWHWFSPFSEKMEPVVTGVIAGAFIAILQFSWDWLDAIGVRRLKSLNVSNVLSTRDDEAYYRKKIQGSKAVISLLGNTAARFVADFADENSPREDKKVLIRALDRGVHVRVLIVADEYLQDVESKQKALSSKASMKGLADKFPNFEVRYYQHPPYHSIFRVDDSYLVGPIFTGRMSKNTPVIEMARESPLVDVYMDYFEREWSEAG